MTNVDEPDPLIGQTMGEFRILELLGAGGMGRVYLAEQAGLERQVAVKVLPQQLLQDKSVIERFEREAKLAAKLTHPNIAQIHTIGSERGVHYVAMELISGGDVAGVIKRKERIAVDEAAELMKQALMGIGSAHGAGIVHRDIKPQNLMLTEHGMLKVMDFGLARALAADSSLTASGTVLGTPLYMSPEQANSQPVDERTDIYALGATFYHMVCGQPPFAGDTPISVMYKHVNEPLTSPKEIDPDLPDELSNVITKMMAKKPEDRYQRCEDALADLLPYCQAHPVMSLQELVGSEAAFPAGHCVPRSDGAEEKRGSAPLQEEEAEKTMAVSESDDGAEEQFPSIEVRGEEGAPGRAAETQAAPPDYSEVIKEGPKPKAKKKKAKKTKKKEPEPSPESESVVREAQTQISKSHARRMGGPGRRRRTAVQEAEARKRLALFGGAIAVAALAIGLIVWVSNRPKGSKTDTDKTTTIRPGVTTTVTAVVDEPPAQSWTDGAIVAFSFDPATVFQAGGKTFVRDLSGKGNDGEVHGCTATDGVAGGALDFDGKDDWVEIPNGGLHEAKALTVATWVNLSSLVTHRLLGSNKTVDNIFFVASHEPAGTPGKWRGIVLAKHKDGYGFGVCSRTGEQINALSEAKPVTGRWVHAVATFSDRKARLYIDGQFQSETPHGYDLYLPKRPLYLGRVGYPEYDAFLPAKQDEVAIWNRGLSDKEIRELYDYSSRGSSYCAAIGKMRAAEIAKVAYENLLGMKFVKLPAGEFRMGLSEEELKSLAAAHRLNKQSEAWIRALETPKHRVRITRGFYMGIHEVTQGQSRRAMGQSPAKHRGDNRPAETDDWRPAEAFCRWLNTHDAQRPEGYEYRLPTEAEWEYACRAGSTTPHHFGPDAKQAGDYAWYSGNSPRVTHDVGLKKPNAWGLYDMYGNVWEWCEDWFSEDYYKGSPTDDPLNRKSGPNHVGRGASWGDPALWCRSTLRIGPPKLNPIGNHGFRVVLAPRREPLAIPRYLVVDLSGGQNAKRYPVTALRDGPPPGIDSGDRFPNLSKGRLGNLPPQPNAYKTAQLVLRRIPAGRFLMGSPADEPGHEPDEVQHEVLLTRDFYAGVFETTQAQYQFIMGVNPATLVKLPDAPVDNVSWIEARGGKWPGGRPAPESFLGRLSAKTGIAFDLPTDAQWEYACRAGTTTSYNSGQNLTNAKGRDAAMDEVGWYEHNAGGKTHPVGLKLPNVWGLYDFHGNLWEWCLDWFHMMTTRPMADPVGPENEPGRLLRGGWWKDAPDNCRSAERTGGEPDAHKQDGFRVFLPETGNVTLYENELGMKFVGIPAGEFLRGTPDDEAKALAAKHKSDEWLGERLRAETPQHKVRITEDFLIGCCEVTVGQFRRFAEATGHKALAERRGGASVFAGGKWQQPPDAGWRNPYYKQTDSHPVTCVSWHDAKAFCNWLNWWDSNKPLGFAYRLATGAEWEYACRAGTTTTYSFGNDPAAVDDYGWTNRNSGGQAHEVARKRVIGSVVQDESGNAWGLYDMHGNVWEWCEDWFSPDAYKGAAEEDPINMTPSGKRVMRGGSWRTSPESARAAFRTEDPPDSCYNNVGFRVVLSPRKASEPRDLELVWTSEDTDGTYCVAWADFDKDGDPDLAVGNKWGPQHYREPGKTKLYRNDDGKLVLAWTEPIAGAAECDDLDWGDYDGDGDPDLAVGNDGGHPTRVYENKDGNLALIWTSTDQDRTCGVGWGDLDGDGDLDLAVANQEQPNRVFINEGDGKFVPGWQSQDKLNSNIVEWADIDGDGDLDLAVGNSGRDQVYRNDGGNLTLAWSTPLETATCALSWADWDNDGDPDLTIGNEAQPNYVYENRGGEFTLVWRSAERDNTRSMALGDWDNDGDLDLACGNEGNQNRIYENVGGDLVLAWSSKEKDQTVSAAWADVDGDGFLDLACGNKGVNRLYRNVPGSELIAEYRFNGDAKDTSGNDRHGGVIGTEPVRDRFGTPNVALYFDGQDDVVEVTDFVDHQFPVEFSLSFWFWTKAPFDQELYSMLQQMTGPNDVSSFSVRGRDEGFFLELVEPGGKNHVWPYPLTDYVRQWQHVVVVKERTKARTYLNSALIGEHYANFLLNLSNQPLNIGGSKPEKGLYFNGMIDDVMIVAKALTERDISRLYNEGNWPMLEALGQNEIRKVNVELKKKNPGYNGQARFVTENGKIVEAWFARTGAVDISALKGQPLRLLELYKTTVGDLSVVKDMPLEWLNLTDTTVTDLSVLKGKPLKSIIMHRCPATDLTPLEGAPLERLTLTPKTIRKGWEVLRSMRTLKYLGESFDKRHQPAAEFWKKYDAGGFR